MDIKIHYIIKSCLVLLITVTGLIMNGQNFSGRNEINVPTDYPTIQEAINAADGGDLVIVDTGTYYENIIYDQPGITVASRYIHDQNPELIEKTIIDGGQNGSVVNIFFGEQLSGELIGFTITNGSGNQDGMGGGIMIKNAKVHLGNMIVRDNTANRGAGIFCFGISEVDMHNVTVENNIAEKEGGGMRNFNTKIVLDNCRFIDNQVTDGKGGAIYDRFNTSSGENRLSQIRSTEFKNNTCTGSTGGVYFDMNEDADATCEIKIDKCIFEGNTAGHSTAFKTAGKKIIVNIRNTIFRYNIASTYNGSCAFGSNTSGGIYNSLFYENIAGNSGTGNAAGASVFGNTEVDFFNCVFEGNVAPTGAALTVGAGGQSHVYNCIFRNNTDHPIDLIDYNNMGGELEVHYSDVENGQAAISVSDLSSMQWGGGNIDEDPMFTGTEDNPYEISEGSPCIDAGSPVEPWMKIPEVDMVDNTRVWDGGSGSAIIDMGAYEFGSEPMGIDVPKSYDDNFIHIKCCPNPFTSFTTLEYTLTRTSDVQIFIYDPYGRVVHDLETGAMTKGMHRLTWDPGNLSAGIYFCMIRAGQVSGGCKIIKIN